MRQGTGQYPLVDCKLHQTGLGRRHGDHDVHGHGHGEPGGLTGSKKTSSSGSILVWGLNPGTYYTFTVTATNAIGISTASAKSSSVRYVEEDLDD